ncbi:MAG: hypothetical protein VSS52_013265 [Thiotrichaceae bacterium]|nr:hypothetical protein [Thiotrichaceae bacterium]
MGFLDLEQTQETNKYQKLGYLDNPFPIRGKVAPEIYVERPELRELQQKLNHFLTGQENGDFWVLEASKGIGKSNFLRHLEWEIEQAEQANKLPSKVVYKYIDGSFISPRDLVERLVYAIGEENFNQLLEQISKQKIILPKELQGTDLWRFFESSPLRQFSVNDVENPHTQFLMKWLMGGSTISKDREKYNIWSKDRMPPAVAFPYLKALIACMKQANIVDKVLLLIDEFEDIQHLERRKKTEFIQTLKSMLNCFNWDMLFIIIAGQESVFTTIASQYTSLADRWHRESLKPIESSIQAVQLARAYMVYARNLYDKDNNKSIRLFKPTNEDIKVIYADLSKEATQRDLLDKLHDWIEGKV